MHWRAGRCRCVFQEGNSPAAVPAGVELALGSPVHEGDAALGVVLQHGHMQEAHRRRLLQHQGLPGLHR